MSILSREGVFASTVFAATLVAGTTHAPQGKPNVHLTREAAKEIALAKEAGDVKNQELVGNSVPRDILSAT